MSCSELSAAAFEPMIGSASRADELLLLEVGGPWARDVLAENDLPPAAQERLRAWVAQRPNRRVLFIRRPGRRSGPPLLLVVECGEHGGVLTRVGIAGYEALANVDLETRGSRQPGPILLVCTHGHRDACCARLGVPLYDAFARTASPGAVWQSSHQGGHRFAGNVLALPEGVQLGRVRPIDAERVAAELSAGLIPLPFYRGRTLHPPEVQAADLHVRERLGEAGIGAVRYAGPAEDGAGYLFSTRLGEVTVSVSERAGPLVPPSCGASPEPTRTFTAALVGMGGW